MDWILKYRKEIFILAAVIFLYFLVRLPNLTLQPIFADEAIYIRWAQVMRSEPTLRFLPLADGKTPLFMWTMIPLFKFFQDPLFAGRFLSIISGFFTLLGVFFLSKKAFNIRTAFWASLLYAITPYTVFFDRMALVDPMLSAFTIWVVYFAIWLARSLRLDLSMILGYLLGGAILTKTPGMTNLLLLPLSIIGFKRIKTDRYRPVKLFIYWGVAIIIALTLYNVLRLGPNFYLLSSRNADYVFSPSELMGRPLDPFIPHFRDISDWFPKLFTLPILFLTIMGIIYIIFRPLQQSFLGPSLVVLLWAIVPLLLSMAFLRTFTARYLLSSIPLLLILAGFGLSKILERVRISNLAKVVIAAMAVLPMALIFDYQLITNPPPQVLPKEERRGYFEDWTAGYGFGDIASFLIEQSKSKSVVVGTEGFFGTLPDGLQIYLDKSKISIIGSHATISAQIRQAAYDHLTFFVGNKNRLQGRVLDVKLIKEYPKAKSEDNEQDAIVLYQVLPTP